MTVRGVVLGLLVVTAGMFTWTYTGKPLVIWAVLLVTGVLCLWWGRPYLQHLKTLPRLGAAWLGIAYWLLGIAGALLSGHLTVAMQRLLYAGVFTLVALAVVAAGRDLTTGLVAGYLVMMGLLLLAGAGTLFDGVHAVPNDSSATLSMADRFWGGPLLFYHPNSFAGLAVFIAIRIGPDRRFATWQRLAVTGLGGAVLLLTNSRTAFLLACVAAGLHAVPALRRWRAAWAAIGTPVAVLALVLVLSGGQGFLFQSRFGGSDVTSGRGDTWMQAAADWELAGVPEMLFGDARTSRAVV